MKPRSGCSPQALGPLSLWVLGLFTALFVGLLPKVGWWVVLVYLAVTCLLVGTHFLLVGIRRRYGLPEPDLQARADRLCAAAKEALRHAPISPDRKASIREQVGAVSANIKASREKLKRLRNLQNLTIEHRGKRDEELARMERSILNTMNEAIDLLLGIPKSLMRVETVRDERLVGGILSALSETNKRMEDLADAHAEMAASERFGGSARRERAQRR